MLSHLRQRKKRKKDFSKWHFHSKDGSEIKGAIIPVRVEDLSLLGGFKRVSASNAENAISFLNKRMVSYY